MTVRTPPSLLGVGRVFRPGRHVTVVVVDFPKELLTGDLETAEVMLAMRIVVRVEARKALNLDQRTGFAAAHVAVPCVLIGLHLSRVVAAFRHADGRTDAVRD
jgi:hypothetical protein